VCDVDIETVLAELYQSARAEFIPIRDERANQARSAGDRDLAAEITALRKPTVAAWLINHVSEEYPDDLGRLTELGADLRRAHQELAGDRLRDLSRQRNELLRTLDDRTLRVARRAKVAVNDQVADQVRAAFVAALLDADVLATVRTARLSTAPSASADTGWPTLQNIPEAPKKPAARKSTSRKPTAERGAVDERKKAHEQEQADQHKRTEDRKRQVETRRREELSKAKHEAKLAETARAKANRELAAARKNSEHADAELEEARKRVEQARADQRAAKLAAASAQQTFDSAERNAAAAQRAVAALEKQSH